MTVSVWAVYSKVSDGCFFESVSVWNVISKKLGVIRAPGLAGLWRGGARSSKTIAAGPVKIVENQSNRVRNRWNRSNKVQNNQIL